jgi:pyridoxamine 5'-phosphate oxidase
VELPPRPSEPADLRAPTDVLDVLAQVRAELEAAGLRRADLDPDPIVQVRHWWEHAAAVGVHQAETIALATADADGRPSVRFVLARGLDVRGLVFFTNLESRKAEELAANPWAATVFAWTSIGRQARLAGRVERVDDAESDAYFATRARGSQLSAWASQQSRPVADRAELDRRRAEVTQQFGDRPVPRPSFWGGFRLVPTEIELWQGRADRYHDRFRYCSTTGTVEDGDAPRWTIERLGP